MRSTEYKWVNVNLRESHPSPNLPIQLWLACPEYFAYCLIFYYRLCSTDQTDGWKDRRAVEHANGRANGRTDERPHERTRWRTDERTRGRRTDGRTRERTDRRADEEKNEQTNASRQAKEGLVTKAQLRTIGERLAARLNNTSITLIVVVCTSTS